MIAAQEGDVCVVIDVSTTYIWTGTLWTELLVPPNIITSVNNETGNVVIVNVYQNVVSEAAMNMISAIQGDLALRTDVTETFVYDGTDWVALLSSVTGSNVIGTANQVNVTDNGDGTITLSTPQDIAPTSAVVFNGITNNNVSTLNGRTDITAEGPNTRFIGTSQAFLEFYPQGIAGGRKMFFGFDSSFSDNVTLQNSGSGAIIVEGNSDVFFRTNNAGGTQFIVNSVTSEFRTNLNVLGNITTTGTVDGVDLSTLPTNLKPIN